MSPPDAVERGKSVAGNVSRPARLVGEDVEPDAEAALLDGLEERRVVDEIGARRVDEHRPLGQEAR